MLDTESAGLVGDATIGDNGQADLVDKPTDRFVCVT